MCHLKIMSSVGGHFMLEYCYINTNEIQGDLLHENLISVFTCENITVAAMTTYKKTIKMKWFGSSLVFIGVIFTCENNT